MWTVGSVWNRLMRGVAIVTLAAGVALAAVYLGACWHLVRSMITLERKPAGKSPAELGFPDAEAVSFTTSDGVGLVGWFLPAREDRAILLVHGIYSNAWNGQAPDVVRAYLDAGFSVFLYDARGQGRSEGTLGFGWYERQDVRAAAAVILARGFQPGRIGLHGTSYGAATALVAAAGMPEVGAVVADSAFADVRDVMVGEVSRRLGLSLRWARLFAPGLRVIMEQRYGVDLDEASPENAIGAIAPRAVLLIHGDLDPVIPVGSIGRLRTAAGANAEAWVLSGRLHTEGVRLAPDYERASSVRDAFLRRVVQFFRDHL